MRYLTCGNNNNNNNNNNNPLVLQLTRAKASQPTAGLTSTYPQTVVNGHPVRGKDDGDETGRRATP